MGPFFKNVYFMRGISKSVPVFCCQFPFPRWTEWNGHELIMCLVKGYARDSANFIWKKEIDGIAAALTYVLNRNVIHLSQTHTNRIYEPIEHFSFHYLFVLRNHRTSMCLLRSLNTRVCSSFIDFWFIHSDRLLFSLWLLVLAVAVCLCNR